MELRKWIAVKGAARHLTSIQHSQALERAQEAKRVRERLEEERQADVATTELRDVEFAAQRRSGPIASAASKPQVMSEMEAEMWEDYRINGAEFSAGEDAQDAVAQHKRLLEESESFGLWNPETMARKLGFGPDESEDMAPILAAEDEEDDFLAEIMRNIGEFLAAAVEMMRVVGRKDGSFTSR